LLGTKGYVVVVVDGYKHGTSSNHIHIYQFPPAITEAYGLDIN
jgi:hypothetical protein